MISSEEIKQKCKVFAEHYQRFRSDPSTYQAVSDDRLLAIAGQLQQYADQVDCKAGCDYCCHYRVAAFTHEIIIIFRFLQQQCSAEERQAILERITANAGTISKLSDVEHFRTNIPCSFLQNQQCLIYPIRPVACAGCYSTSKAVCEDLFAHPEKFQTDGEPSAESHHIEPLTVATKIEKLVVHGALKGLQHDDHRYELNTSLLKLFNQPELAAQWEKNGQPIFED